jgi:hypothetical protein
MECQVTFQELSRISLGACFDKRVHKLPEFFQVGRGYAPLRPLQGHRFQLDAEIVEVPHFIVTELGNARCGVGDSPDEALRLKTN